MTIYDELRKAPFNLDDAAISWIRDVYASLDLDDKIGQLFTLIMIGTDEEDFKRIASLRPGGVTRFFTADLEFERRVISDLVAKSKVPPIISADLEGSRHSFAFGTPVLGQLGLAAVDDVQATEKSSEILAREGRAMGVRWSFTPVIDINTAFRSPIVGTRSYGSDVNKIERHAVAHVHGLQRNGVAATAKHWPGEGYDDRDQHLVTTTNPLSMDEWKETFGRLYRTLITEGVLAIMSGHISLPAYIRSKMPDAGLEAFRPASVSRLLNVDLLRDELGFNGIVVSDATPMGGLSAWGHHLDTLPDIIANGCDMILFSDEPEEDMAAVKAAVEDGRITPERLEEAVLRVLALKAHLKLFQPSDVLPDAAEACHLLAHPDNVAASREYIGRSPTLVKDVNGIFPLDPAKTKRVLLVDGGIIHPLMPQPLEFLLPALLRKEGFEVTIDRPDIVPTPDDFDLVLYALGDESLLVRGRIFVDWHRMGGGGLFKAMYRPWTNIPSVMISFGHPYHLYDAPRVPAYINAYSTMDSVQEAVVDCMLGRKPFLGTNPVDPFCGLEDARY
ncbi:glycoside hydrolase family 3 protein [Rhizobium ruizarguesonis]|jgi:beta-N-acetylhexosaminidase|uniref:glycoside hydrolase family 3 protein n=1 Tax=Rhizobium ruizarguesonis TaxID=2081791 RepID=UPI00102F81CF|nr:glycoside hydrolase family 3 N-terminal domain-containing protein [Rhizobium ruizarguesonis]MBY5854168.1 glycoside hydrolase family 3 protein [Rhizobium leguminosarum]MBY5891451.1 glycoside hydrolase family 3 protein [Rhizobium leguminosarum]QSZ00684.1 glycoside hydrolase family 3 protein [Rhizobium ruizarguesonis]TAY81374.1 glycoside hydrolase family 3 protein [Rhizobium ruizarguesonis]TAZ37007.1 glycoside hydrolase family 3 protein [Rhizobium ruizarguesonis]